MDPVLSSTVDFDAYIKSNLGLMGKRASLGTSKSDSARNSNSHPSRPNSASQSVRARRPDSEVDLSHKMLQLNLQRYEGVVNRAGAKGYHVSTQEQSPRSASEAAVPLQHSWRAHLNSNLASAVPRSIPKVSRGSDGGIAAPRGDLADNLPSPQPRPKGSVPSPTVHRVTSSRISYANDTERSQNEFKSMDEDEFGSYRVRLVTLRRLFKVWAERSHSNRRDLDRRYRDVVENGLYWPKRSCLTWWRYLTTAVAHCRSAKQRRVIDRLWKNYKLSRRRQLQLRRAARLRLYIKGAQFLNVLSALAAKARARRQAKSKLIKAVNHRTFRVVRRILAAWKAMVNQIKAERLLNAEQTVRRDKIASFVQRMQVTAPAPESESTAPSGRNATTAAARLSSAAHARAPGKVGGSTAVGPQRDAKGAGSKATDASRSGSVGRAGRAGSEGSAGAQARAESKASDVSERVNHRYAQHKKHRDGAVDHDLDLQDIEEGEGSAYSPPPSFNELMRNSFGSPSRLSGPGDEALPSPAASPSRPPRPPNSAPRAHNDRGGQPVAVVGPAPGGNAPLTLEERAAQRRLRVAQLHRQAEERVQEKAQQKLALERQKQEKEAEEAEMLRKEAREKQRQAKAQADRRRAETAQVLSDLLGRAKKFRSSQLLVRWGLAPWQRYMELVRLNNVKADSYRRDKLMQAAWAALLGFVIARRTERFRWEHRHTAIAVAHYRRKLLKFVWRVFRLHHKLLMARSKAVTGHFSRFTLCRRSFRAWQIAFERSVRHTTRQLRSVQPRGDRSVLRHFFRQWCAFHAGRLEEREIRHRVNSKWAAVQGWMSGV